MKFTGFLASLFLFLIFGLAEAAASNYLLNGFSLGDQLTTSNPVYGSYKCQPSDNFPDHEWCRNTQQKKQKSGAGYTQFNTLVRTRDGTIRYVMKFMTPRAQTKSDVENEIQRLSDQLDALPTKIEWFAKTADAPASVIAVWGESKIRELGWEAESQVAQGKSPKKGILIDSLGDLKKSAKTHGSKVYKIVGGEGYIFASSFGAGVRGHQHHVAINAQELAVLAVQKYRRSLKAVLAQDKSLEKNDLSLWPKVAELTRNLSLDTSPDFTNNILDEEFSQQPSKKMWSHLWAAIPLSTIGWLSQNAHSRLGVYGTKSDYPEIRRIIKKIMLANPTDPFSEFGHYALGDYAIALELKPDTIIKDVLVYAMGYEILASIVEDGFKLVSAKIDGKDYYQPYGVSGKIAFINTSPELFDNKPLGDLIPDYSTRADLAKAQFEKVLENRSTRHADDAAYMLAWLAQHRGNNDEARSLYSTAMAVGKIKEIYWDFPISDYHYPALRQFLRSFDKLKILEQEKIVDADDVVKQEPAILYTLARTAYRNHDYANTVRLAEKAMGYLKVSPSDAPNKTDADTIFEYVKKTTNNDYPDININELIYIRNASFEFEEFKSFIQSVKTSSDTPILDKIRDMILKYSRFHDFSEDEQNGNEIIKSRHKDHRQALYMIDLALDGVPRTDGSKEIREWLHYRKIRTLAHYQPSEVAAAVKAMQQEAPESALLDDALAEQLFVEAIVLRDAEAMERTFNVLEKNHPRGNAMDNAHSWMAIAYRCLGKFDKAEAINKKTIGRFPLTRHAKYAIERMNDPKRCGIYSFSQP